MSSENPVIRVENLHKSYRKRSNGDTQTIFEIHTAHPKKVGVLI